MTRIECQGTERIFFSRATYLGDGGDDVKIIVLSSKQKKYPALGIMLVILACICVIWWQSDMSMQVRQVLAGTRQVPVYRVNTEKKAISVTLNAADGYEDIAGILDALDEAGVRTTFFALGSWVDRFAESAAAIAQRGHAIQNHSDQHPHINSLSAEAIRADIAAAGRKIEAITGKSPTLFRPPYGEYNDKVVGTAREMGYEVIQWSIDSIDWKGEGQDVVSSRVLSGLHPGGIVLLHTNSKDIVPALRRVLAGAKEQGYDIVPLDELLLPKPYRIDQRGIQSAAVD